MELKEFMEKWKLSERDIIEAAKLTSSICGSFYCENCPFGSKFGCLANKAAADVNNGEEVKKRIQKLLHPNHMDKVTEVLGVKFNERFHVSYGDSNGAMACYLDETGLHLSGLIYQTKSELLQDLLTGKAYIIKKEKKDE